MGKILSDNIRFLQVVRMCSSIKYVLKVIIFSIFILVTGIEKGETASVSCPLGPGVTVTSLWGTRWNVFDKWISSKWFWIWNASWVPRLQRAGLKGEGLALTLSDSPAYIPGSGMLLNVQRGLGYYLERRLASLKGIMVLLAPPPKSGAWN